MISNVYPLEGIECVVCSRVRAFLEDSSDGPVLLCHNVCCHDPGQHLASGIRVQEREVPAKAQVSKADAVYTVML